MARKSTMHGMRLFINAWALVILSVAGRASGQWAKGLAFCSVNPSLAMVSEDSTWLAPLALFVFSSGCEVLGGVGRRSRFAFYRLRCAKFPTLSSNP